MYRNNDGNVIDLNLEQGIINKLKILSDSKSQDLEGPRGHLEVYNALKDMKNGKSPGPDGFTVEF